jgi:pimeloyl-ACP methyl ester carboxylesterase
MGRATGQRDELRALARLGFDELGTAMSGIGGVHAGIAQRVFRAVGPQGAPVRVVHDGISGGIYAGLETASRALGTGADALLGRRAVKDAHALSTHPRGALALAALNGLIGDRLEREGSVLHVALAIRHKGRPVPPEPEAVAKAFPDAAPHVVVFLHGLMETEHSWRYGGEETYGARLKRDVRATPVELRYNTGRHVSENGLSLADELEALVAAWPTKVDRIALVGHSMGGLVARSACHQAAERGNRWVREVRHVVALGTPHMGAPLEEAVHVAAAGLGALPETRPFGSFLRRRSAGIRDLRRGSLVDEDWQDRDPDALRAVICREIPLLDGATHCFVAATITRSERHPVGRLIGDWLVLQPSASGRGRTRRIPFRDEDGLHVGGANHLALLNHPAVYERLRDWLR